MNLNRDSPFRLFNVRRLWWAHDGKLTLIRFDFDPWIVPMRAKYVGRELGG